MEAPLKVPPYRPTRCFKIPGPVGAESGDETVETKAVGCILASGQDATMEILDNEENSRREVWQSPLDLISAFGRRRFCRTSAFRRSIMQLIRRCHVLVVLFGTVLVLSVRIPAQDSGERAVVNKAATAKFAAVPNAPECFTIAVEHGDFTKGPAEVLSKIAPGCVAPWHWHTPNEHVLVVSGPLEVQMKGEKGFIARRGDYAFLPSHHVHRATCKGTAPCLVYLYSDAIFDIHYVDESGKEIPPDQALKAGSTGR